MNLFGVEIKSEPVLIGIVIFLTIGSIQWLIKPRLKKYHDRGWYGLSINIITILFVMAYGFVVYIIDAMTELPIIETGIGFIIQIFGTVFLYEVLKNIRIFVKTNGGDVLDEFTEEESDGEE